MGLYWHRSINYMATRTVKAGSVAIGGNAPVSVQSMTNTPTKDVKATVRQIHGLEEAGCELVRVAIPDRESATALPEIKKQISIPLIADIHFDYRLALAAMKGGADKIRINPGNIGSWEKVKEIISFARKRKTAIRIGINGGSLEREILKKYENRVTAEGMVESALKMTKRFEREHFNNIVLSLKHSDVKTTVQAYESISRKTDYPLHVGLTEAGTFLSGCIKSSVALGTLLYQGIGNTIRVSLTDDPVREIEVALKILEALKIRSGRIDIISCPTCARTSADIVKLVNLLEKELKTVKKQAKIAVMGCVVNGPGEAREADIGLCGIQGDPAHLMLFKKGKISGKISYKEAVSAIQKELEGLA